MPYNNAIDRKSLSSCGLPYTSIFEWLKLTALIRAIADISVHSIDQFLGIGAGSAVMADMTARGFDVRPMSLLPRDLIASVIRAGGIRY